MNAAGIAAQIRRRGNIVEWYHAIPAYGARVDPLTKQPILTAGGPRKPMGPTGETYMAPVKIRVLWTRKISDLFLKQVGIVEHSDSQLTVASPFVADPQIGGQILPELVDAYNAGQFVQLGQNDDDRLLARDKFLIAGALWLVKTRPIPVFDANITVAWRMLIGKLTY